MLAVIRIEIRRPLLIIHPDELSLRIVVKVFLVPHRVRAQNNLLLGGYIRAFTELVADRECYRVRLESHIVHEKGIGYLGVKLI